MEREGETHRPDSTLPASGLEAAYLEHRAELLRFLRARGAGDAAEDILQDVWLRIAKARSGPVDNPRAYLFRAANMTMIDRHRSQTQAAQRERDWSETRPAGSEPSPESGVAASQEMAKVLALVDRLGARTAAVLRRHRIDGLSQRQVADEMGVSLSTVESDLRTAYRAMLEWKERSDEA